MGYSWEPPGGLQVSTSWYLSSPDKRSDTNGKKNIYKYIHVLAQYSSDLRLKTHAH